MWWSEESLLLYSSYSMVVSGAVVAVSLLAGIQASYGRYSFDAGWNIGSRVGWFIQELPSFAIPLYCLLNYCSTWTSAFVLSLFVLHYTNRTFLFPYLMPTSKPTPWFIVFSAFVFCSWNGWQQGVWTSKYAEYSTYHLLQPQSIIGIALFFLGMGVNVQADSILRNLRRPGETGYKIPRGGAFEYVSGANFLGEMLEWLGWSLVAASPTAYAFAFFTAANIGPRAMQHHKWYLSKFDDYPKERKAIIPFLL